MESSRNRLLLSPRKLAGTGTAIALAFTGGCSTLEQPLPDIAEPTSVLSNNPAPNPDATPVLSERRSGINPSTSEACNRFQNIGERIFCTGELYDGIYFRWGGGHGASIKEFNTGCPDPSLAKNNRPHGNMAANNGNPSECGMDSTGFLWAAINNAMGTDHAPVLVRDLDNTPLLKQIPIDQVKKGDIALKPNIHAELIDNIEGQIAHTYGARHTGSPIGPGVAHVQNYPVFLRYVG